VRAARISALGALLMLFSAPAAAASGPAAAEELRVLSVDADSRRHVDVDVVVPRRSTGRTLEPSAFEVRENGQPVAVTTTQLQPRDLDVVITFGWGPDAQGEFVTAIQAATAELIRNLPEGARVGLVGPVGGLNVPLATDRNAALDALSDLTMTSGTDLEDAVSDAARALHAVGSEPARRPAIVVLTGEPVEIDPESLGRAVEGIESPESPVVAIVMTSASPPASLDGVELPGGGSVLAVPPTGLIGATDAVVANLVGRYRLSFQLTDPAAGGVDVRLSDGGVVSKAAVAIASTPTKPAVPGAVPSPAPPAREPPAVRVPSDGSGPPLVLISTAVVALVVAGYGLAGGWMRRSRLTGAIEVVGVAPTAGIAGEPTNGTSPAAGSVDLRGLPAETRERTRPAVVVLLADPVLREDVTRRLAEQGVTAVPVAAALDALGEVLVHPHSVLVVQSGLPRVEDLVRTLRSTQRGDGGRVAVIAVTDDRLDLPTLESADRIIDAASSGAAIASAVDELSMGATAGHSPHQHSSHQ
jgi:hypothetical protein